MDRQTWAAGVLTARESTPGRILHLALTRRTRASNVASGSSVGGSAAVGLGSADCRCGRCRPHLGGDDVLLRTSGPFLMPPKSLPKLTPPNTHPKFAARDPPWVCQGGQLSTLFQTSGVPSGRLEIMLLVVVRCCLSVHSCDGGLQIVANEKARVLRPTLAAGHTLKKVARRLTK